MCCQIFILDVPAKIPKTSKANDSDLRKFNIVRPKDSIEKEIYLENEYGSLDLEG